MNMVSIRSCCLRFLLLSISPLFLTVASPVARATDLGYLRWEDPFYVDREFPKLTTPQWVGEQGIEAVVILAIDDMRESAKYEAYLRPILDRLKRIDGRAPVSIYCNTIDPADPQLQTWLKEGVSLEVHTMTHPCPLLANGDFAAASRTYHDNVDLLHRVDGNMPVAYRMPCCDSMNSPSPRFYSELFNGVSPGGHYLRIDSSVMNISTSRDRSLPREWVIDDDGKERFGKYLPKEGRAKNMGSFVTTVEDYPYPYVIGGVGWEFPAMVPSDWEAQNLHGVNQPQTVSDWKTALDIAVLKQGVFTFIFHPHGWIRAEQMVEFIDDAVARHGKKVKFLTFREADQRLRRHLLAGQGLRTGTGAGAGARLIDLNGDGYLDVVLGGTDTRVTREWLPDKAQWRETGFPVRLRDGERGSADRGVLFGTILSGDGVSMLSLSDESYGGWQFKDGTWNPAPSLMAGLELEGERILAWADGRDQGVRLVDIDLDGRPELIVGNPTRNAVFGWSDARKEWVKREFGLPEVVRVVDEEGRDAGLRFTDLNEDRFLDIVCSNPSRYSVRLFIPRPRSNWDLRVGWTRKIREGVAGDTESIPLIVREGGANNGAWFHSRHLWVQNEDTASLPDQVDRRSFKELITLPSTPPMSPEASLAALRPAPGFVAELVAWEPVVKDPVAFEWGEDGRLWVVEMGDYPDGLDGQGKPGGRVVVLKDVDGDGRYDESSVFLEGLNFPNGVMPWRGGALVSAAPEILYAEDSDGDGKADLKKVLFSGFREGNQQHRINGFEYGLDNWLYAANGDSGGIIRREGSVLGGAGAGGEPVNISGHDVRLRPDEGLFEKVEGQTQFGRRRDDWGNWFGNNNPTFLWHYWVPARYLARNPHLAVRSTRERLANYQDNTRVHAISRVLHRFNWPDLVDTLTSACSPAPYRDELFGHDQLTSVFISEPANNLVHREVLRPEDVTFTSRAGDGEREFLASTDNWFRPTMLKVGPDGALYVADMYRLVIEHTEYALPDIGKMIDLRAGDDRGRIYRVYPAAMKPRPIPALSRLGTAELASSLESPSGWQRDTVQRLLAHRRDPAAVPVLQRLAVEGGRAKTRLQAMCALDGMGALTPGFVQKMLGDANPGVREHAVRLCEPFLRSGAEGPLAKAVLGRVKDPSVRVRYQLAFSLGEWADPRAGDALLKLGLEDEGIDRMQTAVMSSAVPHVKTLLNGVLRARPSSGLTARLLELAMATGESEAVAGAMAEVTRKGGGGYEAWQYSALAGFLDALDTKGLSLKEFGMENNGRFRGAADAAVPLFAAAREIVTDPGAEVTRRTAAIPVLGRGAAGRATDLELLAGLTGLSQDGAVQRAAMRSLGRFREDVVAELVLAKWRGLSPTARAEAVNLLLSRAQWTRALMDALESRRVGVGEIGFAAQQALRRHERSSVAERAGKLFAAVSADRTKLLRAYDGVADLKGNPGRGKELFEQNCATCHRFNDLGVSVGPDLASVKGKPVSDWVTSILDPNRVVESTYAAYNVTTRDGRELTGVVASETGNSITLRLTGGGEEVMLRSDLEEVRSSGLSLMPEGLEAAFPPQAMADLLAFLGIGG